MAVPSGLVSVDTPISNERVIMVFRHIIHRRRRAGAHSEGGRGSDACDQSRIHTRGACVWKTFPKPRKPYAFVCPTWRPHASSSCPEDRATVSLRPQTGLQQ